jgi:hypothetical protein
MLLVVLGIIFALSTSTAIYLAMWQRDVQTPTLIGKPLDQARQLADQAGLKLHEKNSLYDDRVPAKAVIEQWPHAGLTIKRGQSIRVNVSLGPRPAKSEPAPPKPAQEEPRPAPKPSPAPPTAAPGSTIASEKPKTQPQIGAAPPTPEAEKKKADATPSPTAELRFERSEAKLDGGKPKEKKPTPTGSLKDPKTPPVKKAEGKIN